MTACVTCAVYRPTQPPRLPNHPHVCDSDRRRLAAELADIPTLYALLPAVLEPAANRSQRVSGTAEHRAPLTLEVVDLTLPARPASRPLFARGLLGLDDCQTGSLSVATILDTWAGQWRRARHKGERPPEPDVPALTNWLQIRISWACDSFNDIDSFASELGQVLASMRTLLALRRHIDRLQAPCPTCDQRALYREVDPNRGASSWVECGACHRLWSEQEYARLATILAAEEVRAA